VWKATVESDRRLISTPACHEPQAARHHVSDALAEGDSRLKSEVARVSTITSSLVPRSDSEEGLLGLLVDGECH
jgi:hypothetical protein